jgi:SAM-dependent methyltransferase
MSEPQHSAAKPVSLYELGRYSLDWVKDFYDQAGVWWGADPQSKGVHAARLQTIGRLCGPGPKRILELGAGPGASAAALADAGHAVTAIELSSSRAEYARQLANIPRAGSLKVLEADFYTVELLETFDVICCWETFGIGSDADARLLLKRMAHEWLDPQGSILVDVYSPFLPMRQAGTERRLPPLKGVPGSVEMINRCAFDPLHSRWIDEWQPVAEPDKALAQSIRCYTPADFLLLLEGSGLAVKHMEVEGAPLEFGSSAITTSGPLMDAWCYLAHLVSHGTL